MSSQTKYTSKGNVKVLLKYNTKNGVYEIIKNNFIQLTVPNPSTEVNITATRVGQPNNKGFSVSTPANQISGWDGSKLGNQIYEGRRFSGQISPGTYGKDDTQNTIITLLPEKNILTDTSFVIENSDFDIIINNRTNIDISKQGQSTPVKDQTTGNLVYTFPKPTLIDPTLDGQISYTFIDTKGNTTQKELTLYQTIKATQVEDDDDDDDDDVVYGCRRYGDSNYVDDPNVQHDESYCAGDGDDGGDGGGGGTITADIIERRIEEALSNSINNSVIGIRTSIVGGDYTLTEQDRFLQYSMVDDKGNYSPIINWVRGGDLQQVDSEIDVLDSIVLKLESPASTTIQRLDTLDLLKTPLNPLEFEIDLSEAERIPGLDYLQPNFKKEVEDLTISEFSDYENFDNITKTGNATVQQNIIDFYLQRRQNNIRLNTDFTDFKNFVKFGSAEERLMNFYYKVQLLESYTSQSTVVTSVNPSSPELTKLSENIRTVKNSFDDYEYYLYNNTGSFYSSSFVSSSEGIEAVWPKQTETQLYHTTSSIIQDWFSSISVIAQDFDSANKDNLRNNTPEYIREDQNSEDYVLFIDMIGQLFDEIWLHTNELNNLYDWNNNIFKGVSQDLSLVLLNMYADNIDSGFTDKDISEYLLGVTSDNTSIGSNLTNYSFDRQQKETQRRLLTNLPHLLKHKGTKRAITSLVSSYGIPESTLFIQEYGSFQSPTGLSSEFQKETPTYKLKFDSSAKQYLSLQDSSLIGTKAVEFSTQWYSVGSDSSVNVMLMGDSNDLNNNRFVISFQNVGTPTDNTGNIRLRIENASDNFELTSSQLPIYNTQFWNILVQQVASGSYEIHANYFNRQTATFEYQTIASGTIPSAYSGALDGVFNSADTFIFGHPGNGIEFSGYLDELRIWGTPLSSDNFTEHTKFPSSIKLDNALDIPTKLKVRVDIEDQFRDTFVGSPGSIANLVFDPSLPTTVESHNFTSTDYEGFTRKDFILSPNIGDSKLANNKVRYTLNQVLNGNTLTPSNQSQIKIVTKRFRVTSTKLNIEYLDENNVKQTYRAVDRKTEDIINDNIFLPLYIGVNDPNKPLPKGFTLSYIDGTLNIIEGSLVEEQILSEEYIYSSNETIQDVNDINELTIGFSPTEIFNQIILQHFGSTDLVDKYGNPLDQYKDTYDELKQLVENFFSNISTNQKSKFFIDYIRNFDKSLFNNIKKFVPTKANLTTALFIEPHYLNRSKVPRLAKAQSENQSPTGADITENFTVNPPSDFLTDTNDNNPIQTRAAISDVERFIGSIYTIDLDEDGQANAIITENEIGQYLNQNTEVIVITTGFLEDIILYNPPDENMVIRIKNNSSNIEYLFEFRKYDHTQLLEEIEDEIFALSEDNKNFDNSRYVELTRLYSVLFQLNNKLFLIRYPFSGTKPGIPATFEDLQHQINGPTSVIGEGTNEEYEFITGDGEIATGNESGELGGGGTTETSTDSVTRTIATAPNEAIKLTVF